MTKYAFLVCAAAAAACSASSAAPRADDDRPLGTIRWSIDSDDGPRRDDKVQVSFRTGDQRHNSHWSNGYDYAELQGLSPAQLAGGTNQPLRFALVRQAGRLDCSGNGNNRQAIGTCSFAENPAFAARLAAAGIGRPSQRQAYTLTLANVRADLLDELTRNGYENPDLDGLVAMGIHGVTPAYVRDIAAAGYRLGKPEALVKFRIFGIDARFISEMASVGPQFRGLGAEDLVQFKIFGVKPELVKAYAQLGYPKLDSADLVKMQIHGVSPAFVTEMAALGYRNISPNKLVEMRIHGVTPAYVRELQSQGIALPSADQLVRLRMTGFRPGQR